MLEITNAEDLKLIAYVAAALATGKHTNPALKCLSIEGQTIAATDGHRAHWATLQGEYAPGMYQVVKLTKKECILKPEQGLTLPDYKRCIPAKSEKVHEHLEGTAVEYPYSAAIRAETEGATYNYKYFTDACKLSCEIRHAGHMQPLVFQGLEHGALVMPMRKRKP